MQFSRLDIYRCPCARIENTNLFQMPNVNFESALSSEPTPEESLDVNTGAVAGAILIGAAYTQLQEIFFAAMNIKCIGRKTYEKVHKIAAEAFAEASEKSLNAVANEERELALQHNEVIN